MWRKAAAKLRIMMQFPVASSSSILSRVSPPRRIVPRLVALFVLCLAAPRASAQAPITSSGNAVVSRSLPVLSATPSVLASGVVTLSIPASAFPATQAAKVRLRIGLFEANRPVRVASEERDFKRMGDVYQVSFALEADPGAYEFRLLSESRPRVAVSQSAPLLVAGVRREPGWWLLNGSPFVASHSFLAGPVGDATESSSLVAPLFIAGLKRGLNPKAKKSGIFNRAAPETVEGRTLPLPALSTIIKSDAAGMRGLVSRLVAEAKAGGARNLLGFSLPVGGSASALPTADAQNAIVRLRAVLNEIAPDAALILKADVFFHPAQAARDIDSCAALCDAVVLNTFSYGGNLWPLKVARRVAEEQPAYDLPIFLRVAPQTGSVLYGDDLDGDISTGTLDSWMSGLTGIAPVTRARPLSWAQIAIRNAPLFIGSATLEDIGFVPAPEFDVDSKVAASGQAASMRDETELFQALRSARRIPFLARLERRRKRDVPESFAIRLGKRISSATIERLRKAANDGARIYIEGAPVLDEKGRPAPWRMSTLVGATIAPLEKDSNEDAAKRAMMILQDGWMFGTARGTRVEVEQNVVAALLAPDVARAAKAQSAAKNERGIDKLTAPRVAARLEDGSPALVINRVGRGEVIWMPHRTSDASVDASGVEADVETQAPKTMDGSAEGEEKADAASRVVDAAAFSAPDAMLNIDRSTARQRFYAAIASYVQPPLVSLRGTDARSAGVENVRVALRRSAKGTLLLALFNGGTRAAAVAASVDGVARVALNLMTERALPLQVRGFQSEVGVWVPARGFVLLALSDSLQALNEERNAPRLQARLR